MANIKQVSEPETLPELSRNGPRPYSVTNSLKINWIPYTNAVILLSYLTLEILNGSTYFKIHTSLDIYHSHFQRKVSIKWTGGICQLVR